MHQALFLGTASNYVGLTAFTVLFLGTSLITPFVLTILLLSIWFMPMTSKMRKQILAAMNILKSWQYLEVYLISVFLAMWQVGDISEIMVEDICEDLDQLFTSLFFLGIVSQDDARCFFASVAVEKGYYVLIVTSLMLLWLTHFTLKAVSQQCTTFFTSEPDENLYKQQSSTQNETRKKQKMNFDKKLRHTSIYFTDSFWWLLSFSDNWLFSSNTSEITEMQENQQNNELSIKNTFSSEVVANESDPNETYDNVEVGIVVEPVDRS